MGCFVIKFFYIVNDVDGKSILFGCFREPVAAANRCKEQNGLLPESAL